MRLVRGKDVVVRGGAVVVLVRAEGKEREVPVLGAHEHLLLELAQAAGYRPLLGRSNSRNVASTIAAEVVGGTDLPRINAHRMRRTWLAQVTPVAPISAILRATGRQNLGDLGGIADAARLTDEHYQQVLRCSEEDIPLQGQLALFPSYDLTEKRPSRRLLRSVA